MAALFRVCRAMNACVREGLKEIRKKRSDAIPGNLLQPSKRNSASTDRENLQFLHHTIPGLTIVLQVHQI